ncbi:MAG: hypothetical protein K8R90_09125 [Candidatus Cloacimonetes bacterium]|nr:hypothetical protein [Candidatus Cloacimonadota bacterium]
MNRFHFDKINWILLIAGIVLMVVAFIVMGTGDKTLSPLLLALVYLVIFPWAILRGFKPHDENTTEGE